MASSSPTKDAFQFPTLAPPNHSSLNPPASPRRALRRLQSAHTLGSSFNQPSLISQQHKQALQKIIPPVPKDAAQSSTTTHSRARSNSDVTNIVPVPTSSMRRPTSNRKLTATESMSLDRLLRDGPPDGDIIGSLESMRLKILDQGVKSDSDGMVCQFLHFHSATYANKYLFVNSPLCAFTSGLYYSMHLPLKPTHIYL